VFGPRAFLYGTLLFMGYFFGFLAGSEIPLREIYWVAAILWLAALVNLALRVAIFNRVAIGALERARGSFTARAQRVIAAAGEMVTATTDAERSRRRRRLGRLLLRLNENALIIDAQLADPRARLTPAAAQHLHEQLFDLELDLENLSRVVTALAPMDLPGALRV
jgi:hypothetical protein